MSILHKIKAYLYDNALTENPNDYTARVSAERSLGVRDICESATTRGGADVSASAMEHAVELWLKEMGYQLCDGFSVNTGYFTASPHIRGAFDSPAETFNPAKHSVLFELHQGAQLRKELESVTVEVLGVAETAASIAQVTDVKTGSVNDLLTPGRNLRIAGHKIKIVGDNDANGVYFVHQPSQDRIKVEASDIVVNNPSEVIIVIPELGQATYQLEITTQYTPSNVLLKEPRTAIFNKILTVQ